MARKYLLVPPSWKDNSVDIPEKNVPTIIETVDEPPDIVSLFPKRQQNKAKLLFGYLKNVKLDSDNRVIYVDGSIGSTLYDLMRYFITDTGHFSAPKPIDSDTFKHQFLSGVPSAAFGKNKTHEKHKFEWKTLR